MIKLRSLQMICSGSKAVDAVTSGEDSNTLGHYSLLQWLFESVSVMQYTNTSLGQLLRLNWAIQLTSCQSNISCSGASLKMICDQLNSLLAEDFRKGRQLGRPNFHPTQLCHSLLSWFCFCNFYSCRSSFVKRNKFHLVSLLDWALSWGRDICGRVLQMTLQCYKRLMPSDANCCLITKWTSSVQVRMQIRNNCYF